MRAERASLPLHASDMLSARGQAIGGARTFASQDSQHCRLLLLTKGSKCRKNGRCANTVCLSEGVHPSEVCPVFRQTGTVTALFVSNKAARVISAPTLSAQLPRD